MGLRQKLSATHSATRAQGVLKEILMKDRPDFFCIGVQKAGTTWLADNFSAAPGIASPLLKEPHYFDSLHLWGEQPGAMPELLEYPILKRICESIYWSLEPSYMDEPTAALAWVRRLAKLGREPLTREWYASMFEHCEPEYIIGDYTPDYCLLPDHGIRELVACNPAAKYVLMLRDPVERDWSELRMITPSGAIESDYLRTIETRLLPERTDYRTLIERWESHVGRHNLFVGYFDDIKSDPADLLDRVYAFLTGRVAEVSWRYASERVHEGRHAELPSRVLEHLVERNRETLRYGREALGSHGAAWALRYGI